MYRKISNIRRTKSPNLNVSCLVLQFSLPNPMNRAAQSGGLGGLVRHRPILTGQKNQADFTNIMAVSHFIKNSNLENKNDTFLNTRIRFFEE